MLPLSLPPSLPPSHPLHTYSPLGRVCRVLWLVAFGKLVSATLLFDTHTMASQVRGIICLVVLCGCV